MPSNPPAAWNVVFYVYMITNKTRTVLYIGVTRDLESRIREHRNQTRPDSFASLYNLNRLVFFERFADIRDAISREKELKGWKRCRKNELVERENPNWQDLAIAKLGFEPPKDQDYQERKKWGG